MTEPVKEFRCGACGRKIADYAISEGTLRILCKKNRPKENGKNSACHALNVLTVADGVEIFHTERDFVI